MFFCNICVIFVWKRRKVHRREYVNFKEMKTKTAQKPFIYAVFGQNQGKRLPNVDICKKTHNEFG